MEELIKQTDSVYMTETLFDGQAEQGVELDHVLPDYYPEIFKIIKCCVTPRVTSTAISGGKIMLDGTAVIRVLYLAENSNALNCVEQRYTWNKTVDIGKAPEQCSDPIITVIPRTDYCNCRAVSSRRIDVRGAISSALRRPAPRNSSCLSFRTDYRCSAGRSPAHLSRYSPTVRLQSGRRSRPALRG